MESLINWKADEVYKKLITKVWSEGKDIETRNHIARRHIKLPSVFFWNTPLVTLRKTAWKTALREMEWFMSGETRCPEALHRWWDGQLNPDGHYLCGYSHQYRHFGSGDFDQIAFVLNSIRNHKGSRRAVLTTWNPDEMANITKINQNPNTPACCHGTKVQFFVENDSLHMVHDQRSADMLLGLQHNWIQYWALLMFLAYHANLKIGGMQWHLGDAHIYTEESHFKTVYEILDYNKPLHARFSDEFGNLMAYRPLNDELDWNGVPIFRADDFVIEGDIPPPISKTRPKLL